MFALDVAETPTLTFEAKNLREAHEVCRENGCSMTFYG
jgi:hypothetical protein